MTSAQRNIYIGNYVGKSDTIGIDNIGIGGNVMGACDGANANRKFNIAIGCRAMGCLTTGSGNVAIGCLAGDHIGSSQNSTYVGSESGGYHQGYCNTGMGACALRGSGTASNNSGGCNTAVGFKASVNITSGTFNTSIGKGAG